MSKKDQDLLEKHRRDFVQGAVKKGVSQEKADELFDLLARFAEYGFNKSHSASYAVVAYQTAWLKARYPAAFLCSLLSAESGNADKVVATLSECRRLGIEVLPPDINESGAFFGLSQGRIRFGLSAIKHVGVAAVESLIAERQASGPFKDLRDLLQRADPRSLNQRMAESLIKAGALDSICPSGRAQALAELPLLSQDASRRHEDRLSGQTSLFDQAVAEPQALQPTPKVPDWADSVKLGFEKEVLGFYVSGHPLRRHERLIQALRPQGLSSLKELKDGSPLLVCGIVLGMKTQMTKRNEVFARVVLEDFEGMLEVLVWPRVLEAHKALLKKDSMLAVKGRLDLSGDEAKLSAEEVVELSQAPQRLAKAMHLGLDAAEEEAAAKLQRWVQAHPGKLPLTLHWKKGSQELVQSLPKTRGVGLGSLELDEPPGNYWFDL
jgi:DNA polymerase-3 subunit alpha